jgi:DMSO/TMAO reductase YedYZ heme-binding membrane subunit
MSILTEPHVGAAEQMARWLDRTDRYRPLRWVFRGRSGGLLLAYAISWAPVVATLVVLAAYGLHQLTYSVMLEAMLGIVEVPGMVLLAIVLCCTPWSRLSGHNYRPRRRWFGLSFAYCAVMNLALFIVKHPLTDFAQAFAIFATTAVLLTAPLVATSTDGAIRKLGGQCWRRLHRLVYVVAALVVIHLWLVPQDGGPAGNVIATVVFGGAGVIRLPQVTAAIAKKRRQLGGQSLLSLRTWLRRAPDLDTGFLPSVRDPIN